MAATNGNLAIAKLLLAAGACENIAAEGGRTPLLIGAQNGAHSIVKELLKRGVDVNSAADDGVTGNRFSRVT